MKIKNWKESKGFPKVAIDPLIVKRDKIILLKRKIEPFKGMLELPGGMVEYGETVEAAAIREGKEETGLKIKLRAILGVYSNKLRDPRQHTVSVAFIAQPIGGELKGSFEGQPEWFSLDEIDFKELGFDHAKILKDYLKWRKRKWTYWSTK